MIEKALNLISRTALAVDTNINFNNAAVTAGLKEFSVGDFINVVIVALIGFAGLIFFIMLIIGGIQYAMSGGDKAAAQAAKDRITNALIGIVVVAAAYAIKALVTTVLGIGIGTFNINPL